MSLLNRLKDSFSEFFEFFIEIVFPVLVVLGGLGVLLFILFQVIFQGGIPQDRARAACLAAGWPEIQRAGDQYYCSNHERAVPVPMTEVEK